MKKLGTDSQYKRPKKTFQEKLTNDQINDKLKGYERVEDISDVPLNTHIRYFLKMPDGTQAFRTGGFLHNKKEADTYVMLSNGQHIWSVQVKDAIFFRKMTHHEEIQALHNHYQKLLSEKDEKIDKLKKYIKTLNKNYKDNNKDNNKDTKKYKKKY